MLLQFYLTLLKDNYLWPIHKATTLLLTKAAAVQGLSSQNSFPFHNHSVTQKHHRSQTPVTGLLPLPTTPTKQETSCHPLSWVNFPHKEAHQGTVHSNSHGYSTCSTQSDIFPLGAAQSEQYEASTIGD